MKAKLLRDTESINPVYLRDGGSYDFAKYKRDKAQGIAKPLHIVNKAGTEIDHPDCWRLVRCGVAEPLDEECAHRANVSVATLRQRVAAYERLESQDLTEDDE